MPELTIESLSKHYGEVHAIDGIDLTVSDGEFLTLLGPSGCGKSTTLFAVAGLDVPTGGAIRLGERTLFDASRRIDVAPENRNLGLVFQSYALWPHMTVAQNMAFPLSIRRVGRAERRKRVEEALALVEMEEHFGRYPHELSGGQQQRVALARTLVFRPSLLLLDEPLSNLDAKLRIRARVWLKQLQKQLGITTIYVTHDQVEALALSDRIAVMQKGAIVQLATPETVYRRPASSFVADFIGSSNFLNGRLASREESGTAQVVLEDGRTSEAGWAPAVALGTNVLLSIRPEHVRLSARPSVKAGNTLRGRIVDRSYLGARYQYVIDSEGVTIAAECENAIDQPDVFLSFAREDAVVLVP